MADLQRTKAEQKKDREIIEDQPDYPWGTRVHLQKIEIEKLKAGALAVGDEVMVVATAKVIGRHSSASSTEDDHESMELQLTDMELTKKADDKSMEDVMYGES